MRAATMASIIDWLFIIPLIFASSSRRSTEPNDLIIAGIFAFVAIAFRWYKELHFYDRFLLALQLLISIVAVNTFLPVYLSIENVAQYYSVSIGTLYTILFYVVLIAVGIYTTFWTSAGFIGKIGDHHRVKKDSLVLLSCIIFVTLGVIFLPDFMAAWFVITIILWRSTLYSKIRN